MSYRLKISSQNQITLPVDLLQKLGLNSGKFVEIDEIDGVFVLKSTKEVLKELDYLTKDLQTLTQQLKEQSPNWNLNNLIDQSIDQQYQSDR